MNAPSDTAMSFAFADDVRWVRERARERNLRDISDTHIADVLSRFGERESALACLDAICHGATYAHPDHPTPRLRKASS